MSRIEKMVEPLKKLYEQNVKETPKLENGLEIINLDEDKKWFAEHISFYTVIGDIFTEDDNQLLAAIEDLFSCEDDVTILVNGYSRSHCEEDWIKDAMEKYGIHIGNYHFCLVICSNTTSYIDRFARWEGREGVVEILTNVNEIMDFFSMAIRNYGIRVNRIQTLEMPPKIVETDVPMVDGQNMPIGYKRGTFNFKHLRKTPRPSLMKRIREQMQLDDSFRSEPRWTNEEDPFEHILITIDRNKHQGFEYDYKHPEPKYGTGDYVYKDYDSLF